MTPHGRAWRWILVPFVAWAGWHCALIVGLVALSLAESLCPERYMISGMCTAPWFQPVEKSIFAASAGLAGGLITFGCTLAAPSHRREVSMAVLLVGSVAAIVLAVSARAWLEGTCAILSGIGVRALLLRPRSAMPIMVAINLLIASWFLVSGPAVACDCARLSSGSASFV